MLLNGFPTSKWFALGISTASQMNSPDDKMLSVLSRGYGTWDGIAKGEPVEIDNVGI